MLLTNNITNAILQLQSGKGTGWRTFKEVFYDDHLRKTWNFGRKFWGGWSPFVRRTQLRKIIFTRRAAEKSNWQIKKYFIKEVFKMLYFRLGQLEETNDLYGVSPLSYVVLNCAR